MPVTFGPILGAAPVPTSTLSANFPDPLYGLKLYITTSEKKPLVWKGYDSAAFVSSPEESFKWLVEVGQGQLATGSITGYKVTCVYADMLNTGAFSPSFVPSFCYEKWYVTNKVYINGPKKTKESFLAKKGKQFA